METARDLACADLWQASLERSLARRGRPTRSSLELFHLRPERDLSCADILRESASFSQLRRSAASRRPSMALPGAGGISALALLAAATLPGLLGGRGGTVPPARITYRSGAHDARVAKAPVAAANPGAAVKAATLPGTTTLADSSAATVPAHPAPRLPTPAHHAPGAATQAHHATLTPARHTTLTHAHIATAHDATAAAVVAHGVSGGTAPVAQHSVSAAATAPATVHDTAPAIHKPRAGRHHTAPAKHVSTGGGAIEATRSAGHPGTTAAPSRPKAPAQPKPTTHTHPVAKPHPVATTPPAANPPPPPTVAAGHYVNPLAGARVTPERIDQGVDYAGSGPLGAIGDGKITYVGTSGTGWPGAFVEYQLTDGPDTGRYVYYAEGISPAPGLHVGQSVRAGQPIAEIIAGDSNGIEIGWGAGIGTESYAMQHGQWQGGDDADSVPSAAGKDFSALIAEIGGPPGKIEG